MAETEKAPFLPKVEPDKKAHVGHVVAILSGKGGVGKSFTSSYLAVLLRRMGYKVGILDADVTGPSIPYAFNVKGPVVGDGTLFFLEVREHWDEVAHGNEPPGFLSRDAPAFEVVEMVLVEAADDRGVRGFDVVVGNLENRR